MPVKTDAVFNGAPKQSETALLMIDVINGLEFPNGHLLLRHSLPMARRLRELKRHVKSRGIPTIHVNDGFGQWRSNFPKQVEHCLRDEVPGQALVQLLMPIGPRASFNRSECD